MKTRSLYRAANCLTLRGIKVPGPCSTHTDSTKQANSCIRRSWTIFVNGNAVRALKAVAAGTQRHCGSPGRGRDGDLDVRLLDSMIAGSFEMGLPMRKLIALLGATSMFVCATAAGQVTRTPHGELLYSTYCNGCHTTEVHWRAKKLASDWTSLKYQVRRWQDNMSLGWGEDDVAAVARYLNGLYYHFPIADRKRSDDANATPQLTAFVYSARNSSPLLAISSYCVVGDRDEADFVVSTRFGKLTF
jgi:mono/diheme cytochrome c family protein